MSIGIGEARHGALAFSNDHAESREFRCTSALITSLHKTRTRTRTRVFSRGMRWCIAIIALAGCDKLFDVEHVDLEIDAAIDAPPIFLDAPEPCPTSYVTYAGTPAASRYLFVGAQALWLDAEADCEGDTRTKITHLVVFDDPSEMMTLRTGIEGQLGGNTFAAHAGAARDFGTDKNQFFAVTGEPLPLSGPPWGPSEPSNIDIETTTRFESFADLTDQPPTNMLSHVCECDHRKAIRTFTIE
jgi:hypothetical protein